MNGNIPVLFVEGQNIPEAWENSLIELHKKGCSIKTEYDKPEDPPSLDSSMTIVVHDPLAEPMIHMDMPGGIEDLQEYVLEVTEGIKDHLVRNSKIEGDTRWEYTYHQRLFNYSIPNSRDIYDQIDMIVEKLSKTPYSRRAQAITWKVWEDNVCYDPACLQNIWCRMIKNENGVFCLNGNIRFRSNDAYKAAFMNMFALVQLLKNIATKISEKIGEQVKLGRYVHQADSYHLYGSYFKDFEERFIKLQTSRTFEQRTMSYSDMRMFMDDAIPAIREKAANMGK
jgi:thymidylate synthase